MTDGLVVVANRLPVVRSRGGVRRADGGLVSALWPALGERDGAWVGWDGGASVPRHVEGLGVELHGVTMERPLVDGFYHGFANRTLWPLLHGALDRYALEHRWWSSYRAANERFADAAAAAVGTGREVWIHDYHLMLLPQLLAERVPEVRSLFFLHVPFPPPEIWLRLPWHDLVADGMLHASTVAFQTVADRDNFARTCATSGIARVVDEETLERLDGTRVRVVAHPIGIDARSTMAAARRPEVERELQRLQGRFAGRRVLLGVDRLDYTKGILERLRAFEILLDTRRDLRRHVVLAQLAVPSRGDIREYRELREAVEAAVGRINGRFTEPGGEPPVHYLYRGVPQTRLLALYRLADTCLVTALRDGMNLVAKEFVAAQAAGDGAGALVLSEFAGAWQQLGAAVPCNPHHPEGLAGVYQLALELDDDERRRRLRTLAANVTEQDVFWWVDRELAELAAVPRRARAEAAAPSTVGAAERLAGVGAGYPAA